MFADYHLDEGDGVDAIVALRWKFGPQLPAALITADRSEDMRQRAAEKDVAVLNKPLKPAALRALLAQWRGRARKKRVTMRIELEDYRKCALTNL